LPSTKARWPIKGSENEDFRLVYMKKHVTCRVNFFSGTDAGLPNLFCVAGHFHMSKFIAGHKRFCDVTLSYCEVQTHWFW